MDVVCVILPTTELIGAGLTSLRAATRRASADSGHVVYLWRGKYDASDRICSRVVEVVLFPITVSGDRPADYWNAERQWTAAKIILITMCLSKCCRVVPSSVVISRDDLYVAEHRFELATPSVPGDGLVIAEIAEAEEEVRIGCRQPVKTIHRVADRKAAHVSRSSK